MKSKLLVAAGRTLDLRRPRVMGVLNITPDSFSDGGQLFAADGAALDAVVARAEAMIAAGADILDIGGESSRPGAEPVSLDEELRRVMPVVERLAELDTMISVDTYKPQVAARVMAVGCHLINDIGGGQDPQMLEVLAQSSGAYCIMHMQGRPRDMQQNPVYQNVVQEVGEFLAVQVERAQAQGIDRDRLLIDPGFGFGKTLEHNLQLLAELGQLRALDIPLLVGMSRKRMLGTVTGKPVEQRLAAGVAAATVALMQGAAVVRSHDVAATADAVAVISALDMRQ
ncbi:MAG: dihydropteroate synthase [Pseudomonadales bacterium]